MGSPHQRFVIAQTLVTRFPAATAVIVEAKELSINIHRKRQNQRKVENSTCKSKALV